MDPFGNGYAVKNWNMGDSRIIRLTASLVVVVRHHLGRDGRQRREVVFAEHEVCNVLVRGDETGG